MQDLHREQGLGGGAPAVEPPLRGPAEEDCTRLRPSESLCRRGALAWLTESGWGLRLQRVAGKWGL